MAQLSPFGYRVRPVRWDVIESEAHAKRVVRVVVVVRVASRVDVVEVVRVANIRAPLPPVAHIASE